MTEGGATDSYDVALSTPPASDVTVSVTPDAQVAVDKTSLTFTTSDWNTAQTVTVSAVDDTSVEGNHSGLVTHSIATGNGDSANYPEGMVIANVTATITDNDAPPPPDTSTGSSNSGSTSLPTTMNLKIDFGGNGSGSLKIEQSKDSPGTGSLLGTCVNGDECYFPNLATASWVKITPTANAGSEFKGWGGSSYCQNGNPFMISNMSCIAYFNLIAPQSPLGLVAKAASETQIDLNWVDRNTTETGHIIERSSDHLTWAVLTQIIAKSTTLYRLFPIERSRKSRTGGRNPSNSRTGNHSSDR